MVNVVALSSILKSVRHGAVIELTFFILRYLVRKFDFC